MQLDPPWHWLRPLKSLPIETKPFTVTRIPLKKYKYLAIVGGLNELLRGVLSSIAADISHQRKKSSPNNDFLLFLTDDDHSITFMAVTTNSSYSPPRIVPIKLLKSIPCFIKFSIQRVQFSYQVQNPIPSSPFDYIETVPLSFK